MQRWFKNYGFATLVMAGAAAAAYTAATVAVPDPVPDFALKAREIYRLEVGMAFFISFYLAAMALVLAIDGRGFAELGTRGLRARTVVKRTATEQQKSLSQQRAIDLFTNRRLDEHEARLQNLERQSLS